MTNTPIELARRVLRECNSFPNNDATPFGLDCKMLAQSVLDADQTVATPGKPDVMGLADKVLEARQHIVALSDRADIFGNYVQVVGFHAVEVELLEKAEQLAQAVKDEPHIMYQSAVSGLWYTNKKAAGDLSAVRINGDIITIGNEEHAKQEQKEESIKIILSYGNKAWKDYMAGVIKAIRERGCMSNGEQKNDIALVWERDPQDRKCRRLSSETETDWCMADAARESLREHMKLLKEAQKRIAYLESLRMKEIVIGDRLVDQNGDAQGTVLSIGQWDKRIAEAELFGTWCQIIIRPIKLTEREGG